MRLNPAKAPPKLRRRLVPSVLTVAALMLVAGSAMQIAWAAYPGANGKIAFAKNSDIYVMEADGTNVTQLTFTPGINDTQPVISSDGTKIAFTSDGPNNGGFHIWVMGIDGSNPTQLTTDTAQNPSWSPDGKQIAFESGQRASLLTNTIWVMNADGSNQHLVIDRYPFSNVSDPAWSPDGSRIAYVLDNPGPRISVASAVDGSGEVILTDAATYARAPAWAPDGSKLAYQHYDPATGVTDIYVISVATGVETNLTADAANDDFPAYSPDGSKIAYAVLSGQYDIWVMNADGTGKVNVTNNNPYGSESNPDWGPAPATPLADTTPPTITAPPYVTVEATSLSDTVVPDSTLGTATASDNSGTVSVSRGGVPPGNHFPLGATVVMYTATDPSGNSAGASQLVTVVDTTPPTVNVPADKTVEATSAAGRTLSFAGEVSASDLVWGSITPSCSPASGSTFPLGPNTVTCSATDGSGNTGHAGFTITVLDTTPPALTPPNDISVYAASNSSAVVSYSASAFDLVDGPLPISCSPASGSTFTVGSTTVTCAASDSHGNTAAGSFKVNVLYEWSGFFAPVNNPNVVNTAKAGNAIPVKFSLSGNQGMSIFAAGYPLVQAISCSSLSSNLTDPVETTVTAGSSSLNYDSTLNQYTYVWKTQTAWAGLCERLDLKLLDGTVHSAYFHFSK